MRIWRICALVTAAVIPAACRTPPPAEPMAAADIEVVQQPRWISAASAPDHARIDRLWQVWQEVLAHARRAGQGRRITAEGPLLDPDAGQPWPAPSPGAYLCRMIRLDSEAARAAAMAVFPDHFCHVGYDGEMLFVTKRSGDVRPNGFLWEDNQPRRLIFLGSLAEGGEETPPAYGQDPGRDIVGVFERIGPLRYRLVMPRDSGAKLEVLELTPAPVQPEG